MGIYEKIITIGSTRLNEPLSGHTTFRIGGKARAWVRANTIKDLKDILKLIKKNNLKFIIIGYGSNLLFDDNGFDGVVISLGRDFQDLKHNGRKIFSGAAVSLNKLISYACNFGLSGIDALAGIPGTVGGALAMNAGARESAIGDFAREVFVVDYNSNFFKISKEDIKFGYRNSNLSKYIILGAWFDLNKKPRQEIKKNINDILKLKRDSQDLWNFSAGCIFKNPKNNFAGRLIERCGLKGRNIGRAFVSNKHANFIINKGGATSKDVLELISLIKREVKNKFNICLKPEIKIIN